MRKLVFLVLAVFITFNAACARENEDITLPDYSDWGNVKTTILWQTKDGTAQGVFDVVLYGNADQDGKRHTILAFKHPNEEIQLAWYEIIDHESKTENDYFFEKRETDRNWLFVADISNLGATKLNDFLDKRYHFQF